jgi:integrase
MAIRKRGKGWQIDYFDPNKKRIRVTFKTKKEATAELGKRQSLMVEKRYLDVKKDYTTTLGQLIEKYKENFKHQKYFKTTKKYHMENFLKYFGEKTILVNINYEMIETYKNHLREKPTRYENKKLRKASTINREMVCLRQLFSKASEWSLIERNPFDRGKPLLSKEDNKRFRYLKEEEIKRLLPACPPHLRNIVECALLCGMRKTEILTLKWSMIIDGSIYLEETKSPESRQVPISDDLAILFKRIGGNQGKKQQVNDKVLNMKGKPVKVKKQSSKYVFTYEGQPIKDIMTSFKTACKNAEIPYGRETPNGVTFHDLRHTSASHYMMRGGKIEALQEILGHEDIKTTQRYAHLSPEYKKKEINLLNGLTSFAA